MCALHSGYQSTENHETKRRLLLDLERYWYWAICTVGWSAEMTWFSLHCHQMNSPLLFDLVIPQRTLVVENLSTEDEALFAWFNAFLLQNLFLHVADRGPRLHINADRLRSWRFHKYEHFVVWNRRPNYVGNWRKFFICCYIYNSL